MPNLTKSPELNVLPMILAAVRRAQGVLVNHIEPGGPSETDTINELLGILDSSKLVRAMNAIKPTTKKSARKPARRTKR